MGGLSKLPNIGKYAEEKLIAAGIETSEELLRVGSKAAFLRIRENDPTVCLHLLYGLEGAVQGIKDSLLSVETKKDLTAFFKNNKL